MKSKLTTLLLILLGIAYGRSQGFINLNFENATFVTHPFGSPAVYSANAIQGWIPYLDNSAQDYVASNGASLGGAQINIEGTNNPFGYLAVQGKYFILLQGGSFAGHSSGLGQTEQIPITTQSILFWGALFGGAQVLFNGNPLSFAVTGTTPNNYNIYQADISAYAGQTGELLFFTPFNTSAIIDNIQFSSTAVPEPSALALTAIGAAWLGFRRWKK